MFPHWLTYQSIPKKKRNFLSTSLWLTCCPDLPSVPLSMSAVTNAKTHRNPWCRESLALRFPWCHQCLAISIQRSFVSARALAFAHVHGLEDFRDGSIYRWPPQKNVLRRRSIFWGHDRSDPCQYESYQKLNVAEFLFSGGRDVGASAEFGVTFMEYCAETISNHSTQLTVHRKHISRSHLFISLCCFSSTNLRTQVLPSD